MKKLAKALSLILVLALFALMAMGSGSSSSSTSEISTDSGSTQSSISNSDSQNAELPTIEEQVLFEQDGVKVTAKEYVTDSIWGDGVKLLVENNSNTDIGVGCDALIVNNYMISDLFSSTVAAGKKANETLYISSSELNNAGITEIGQIEIYFHTFDSNSYMTISSIPCVTIKTSLFDQMDTTPNDTGKELYNAGGIKIVGKYVSEDSFWGKAIVLYIENQSGQNIIVQCDDMSINGFMVSPFFSSTVYNGKMAIDEITIFSSDLEENDITEVEDVELKFKILNPDTFMTIAETEPISFTTD